MKKNRITISTVLKDMCIQDDFTKAELAAFLGCEEEQIGAWESGTSEPSISQCLVLSRLYGTPLDELFANVEISNYVPVEQLDRFSRIQQVNRAVRHWYD